MPLDCLDCPFLIAMLYTSSRPTRLRREFLLLTFEMTWDEILDGALYRFLGTLQMTL